MARYRHPRHAHRSRKNGGRPSAVVELTPQMLQMKRSNADGQHQQHQNQHQNHQRRYQSLTRRGGNDEEERRRVEKMLQMKAAAAAAATSSSMSSSYIPPHLVTTVPPPRHHRGSDDSCGELTAGSLDLAVGGIVNALSFEEFREIRRRSGERLRLSSERLSLEKTSERTSGKTSERSSGKASERSSDLEQQSVVSMLSYEEFRELRRTSREMRNRHEARYGPATYRHSSNDTNDHSSHPSSKHTSNDAFKDTSTKDASRDSFKDSSVDSSRDTSRQSSKDTTSKQKTKKGINLGRIRNILNSSQDIAANSVTNTNTDSVSSSVGYSKDKDPNMGSQLEASGTQDHTTMPHTPPRTIPERPITSTVKKATKNFVSTAGTLSTVVAQAASEAVDVTAKVATNVATTAVAAANTMAEVTATSKTPARSNLSKPSATTNINNTTTTRYADYVPHQQDYIILTPPKQKQQDTPSFMMGALAAGRCALPEDHPHHIDYIPKDIPREFEVPEDWQERAGFVRLDLWLDHNNHHYPSHHDQTRWSGDNQTVARTTIDTVVGLPLPIDNHTTGNPIDMDNVETYDDDDDDNDDDDDTKQSLPPELIPDTTALNDNNSKNNIDEADKIDGELLALKTGKSYEGSNENNMDKEVQETQEVEEEELDPRNHSMWVAAPDDEDYQEDDDIMELGQVVIHNHNFDHDQDNHHDQDHQLFNLVSSNIHDDPDSNHHYHNHESMDEEFDSITDDSKTTLLAIENWSHDGTVHIGDASLRLSENWSHDGTIHIGDLHFALLDASQLGDTPIHVFVADDDDGDNDDYIEDDETFADTLETKPTTTSTDEPISTSLEVLPESINLRIAPDSVEVISFKTLANNDEEREETRSTISDKHVLFEENETNNQLKDDELYLLESSSTEASKFEPPQLNKLSVVQENNEDNEDDDVHEDIHEYSLEPKVSTEDSAQQSAEDSADYCAQESAEDDGRRKLKGRVLFLRIGKKISKVKSRGKTVLQRGGFVYRTFFARKQEDEGVFVSIPTDDPHHLIPFSPSSTEASISASILSNGTGTKRFLGAVPLRQDSSGLQYGVIDYHQPLEDETSGGTDTLPPPPKELPPRPSPFKQEDSVSYLAAAMNPGLYSDAATVISHEDILDTTRTKVESVTPNENCEDASSRIENCTLTPLDCNIDKAEVVSSAIQPNRLFDDIRICTEDRHQEEGYIVDVTECSLTPSTAENNANDIFRTKNNTGNNPIPTSNEEERSIDLPSPTFSEDETILYHDGCTVIQQTSTWGDHTIATTQSPHPPKQETTGNTSTNSTKEHSSANVQEESRETLEEASEPAKNIGSPEVSPDRPSFSRQAAKNGSFLFSPDNMGRAGPRIRAKERALLKGKPVPTITVPPVTERAVVVNTILESKSYGSSEEKVKEVPVKEHDVLHQNEACDSLPNHDKMTPSMDSPKDNNNVVSVECTADEECGLMSPEVRHHPTDVIVSDNAVLNQDPLVEPNEAGSNVDGAPLFGNDPSFEDPFPEVPGKPILSSLTDERQFSFRSTLKKFSSEDDVVRNHEACTPVSNGPETKKRYPTTPFPDDTPTTGETHYSRMSNDGSFLSVVSPSRSSTSTLTASSPRAAPSSQRKLKKKIPKSALKARRGIVKERVTDIQQRIEVYSGVTDVNGRLKRNHSYRYKKPRRLTNGEKALAPRKAILQNPIFIRSVPIGIAKSYSRDDSDRTMQYFVDSNGDRSWRDLGGIGGNRTQIYLCPSEESDFASLEMDRGTVQEDSIAEEDDDQVSSYVNNLYSTRPENAENEEENISDNARNSRLITRSSRKGFSLHSESDASSFASEVTEYDAFHALLGIVNANVEDEQPIEESNVMEEPPTPPAPAAKSFDDKENEYSSDNLLPFKSDAAIVKPSELNHHLPDRRYALKPMSSQDLQLSPLQRTPMQARKWRTMAAAAAEKKSNSKRFGKLVV